MHNTVWFEGSIVEAYIAMECVTFCLMYLNDIEIRFNHTDRNADREWGDDEPTLSIFKQMVRPLGGRKYEFMDMNELSKAYFYVLNNYKEIKNFIEYHFNIFFNMLTNFLCRCKIKNHNLLQ